MKDRLGRELREPDLTTSASLRRGEFKHRNMTASIKACHYWSLAVALVSWPKSYFIFFLLRLYMVRLQLQTASLFSKFEVTHDSCYVTQQLFWLFITQQLFILCCFITHQLFCAVLSNVHIRWAIFSQSITKCQN